MEAGEASGNGHRHRPCNVVGWDARGNQDRNSEEWESINQRRGNYARLQCQYQDTGGRGKQTTAAHLIDLGRRCYAFRSRTHCDSLRDRTFN